MQKRRGPSTDPWGTPDKDGMMADCFPPNGIKRVQALADISRSALCCHSNETCAHIANPPNSEQLEGTPTITQLTSGSVQ